MTNGRPTDHILLTTLGKNWWMVGARGLLAILLGLAVLLRPGLSLTADRHLRRLWCWTAPGGRLRALGLANITARPILFEGAVSLCVGWIALGWPLVPRDAVRAIAAWGLLTGVLELIAAARLPRGRAGAWLLLTGGVFSLFLAVLILMLPHAVEPSVARAVGVYALLFGGLLAAAAVSLRSVAGR
jgi:uncharacterized membrane protein HdeD (DUF308 family)